MHVVSFDVPFPADYGGVIDVFYRLKALHKAGVKVFLHCFEYGRGEQSQLEKICDRVYYYKRKRSVKSLVSGLPFIVASRNNSDLLSNLQLTNDPILFEGLHSTFYLDHPDLSHRKKIVRIHNIEHVYYGSLSEASGNILRRSFFKTEAAKLKKFEPVLKNAHSLAVISEGELSHFKQYSDAFYLPAFHGNSQVMAKTGKGSFILFHGNLSVPENNEAALYIIKNIAPFVDFPFIIAGKNPGKILKQAGALQKNVTIKGSPSNAEMRDLISAAHINLLLTFRPSGIKLKLLNALFNGSFCVANPLMIENTGLNEAVLKAETDAELQRILSELLEKDFSSAELKNRNEILFQNYSDEKNTKDFIIKVWSDLQ